jgi:hypothetical protein
MPHRLPLSRRELGGPAREIELLLRNHCDTCLERTLAALVTPEEPAEADPTHDSVFAPQARFPLTPP